jgi:hypothetical protein
MKKNDMLRKLSLAPYDVRHPISPCPKGKGMSSANAQVAAGAGVAPDGSITNKRNCPQFSNAETEELVRLVSLMKPIGSAMWQELENESVAEKRASEGFHPRPAVSLKHKFQRLVDCKKTTGEGEMPAVIRNARLVNAESAGDIDAREMDGGNGETDADGLDADHGGDESLPAESLEASMSSMSLFQQSPWKLPFGVCLTIRGIFDQCLVQKHLLALTGNINFERAESFRKLKLQKFLKSFSETFNFGRNPIIRPADLRLLVILIVILPVTV